MERHNKLHYWVAELAGKAFTPTNVSDDPIIFTGRAVHGGKFKAKGKGSPPKDKGELKGDLLIRYLWMQGMDSIHDMRVVNTETVSYQSKTPEKCLDNADHRWELMGNYPYFQKIW